MTPANIWLSVATGLAGLLGGFILGRRKRRFSPDEREQNQVAEIPQPKEPPPAPIQAVVTTQPPSKPEPPGDFHQLMLGMVDAIDEIELRKKHATPGSDDVLSAIQGRLQDLIELSDGELIQEKSWQPTMQRAVKVEPAESGQTDVRFLQTRATGLKHAGRIIRKQEVIISQPKS